MHEDLLSVLLSLLPIISVVLVAVWFAAHAAALVVTLIVVLSHRTAQAERALKAANLEKESLRLRAAKAERKLNILTDNLNSVLLQPQ
jgi:hypothetical protein